MGLLADIQTDVAAAFDGDLADAVKSFIIERGIEEGYDTSTGNVSGTPDSDSSRGVFISYTIEEIQRLGVSPKDVMVIILQSEITMEVTDGCIITRSEDNQKFRVKSVEEDPAKAIYIAHCRYGT